MARDRSGAPGAGGPNGPGARRTPAFGLRRAAGPAGGTLVAGALALLVLGGTMAAPTAVTPPWGTTHAQLSVYHYVGGCAKARTTVPEQWNTSSWSVEFASVAHARGCHPVPGAGEHDYAYQSAYATLSLKIALPNGTHSVQPTWTVNLTGGESTVVKGACPAVQLSAVGNGTEHCEVYALFEVIVQSWLVDRTTGATWGYTPVRNYTLNDHTWIANTTSCVRFVCHYANQSLGGNGKFSGGAAGTWYFNGTFVRTDRYSLVSWVAICVYTDVEGVPQAGYVGSTARAWADAPGGLTGIQLERVAIV